MAYTVVIPARYGSTRLPGKPLLDIDGLPMIQRVYQQACKSSAARVIIATDDARIMEAAANFGAQACMTDPDHPSGTDRLEQVVGAVGLGDQDIVVNVQGDEPLIPPALIDQVAANLAQHERAGIATLCEPISAAADVHNPNAVKVVFDQQGYALYFSRAPIPWARDHFSDDLQTLPDTAAWHRHIGIYAYRCAFLRRYVQWPPAPLEQVERLEQLRAMYHGVPIHVAVASEAVPAGVDTREDLEAVRARFRGEAGA
jgi:3-deoxy-manno-octulosonate cytidylyltransferase (CMP-KDO synthetase)